MKEIKIGFPIEYEDENNFIKMGLFLRENEIKALEKRLTDGNKAKELQERIDKAIKYLKSNEWGKDYELSYCRTHLLNILQDKDKGDE